MVSERYRIELLNREDRATMKADVTFAHVDRFRWVMVPHTAAARTWFAGLPADGGADGAVVVNYTLMQEVIADVKRAGLVVEMADPVKPIAFEKVMYHVAGIGATSLVGLPLTLAYHADKGTAFVLVGLAILPGIPAWHYLQRASR